MKIKLPDGVTRAIGRAGLQLKKHSPEICIAVGIVSGIAGAVVACKATTKAGAVLEKTKQDLDAIHQCVEHPETLTEEYTEEDHKKDLALVYIKTGVELAKLYAPAIALGALSITSVCVSHNVMRKRNLAMAAAYTAVDNSFKTYRNRVLERFGEGVDRELRYNIKAREIEENVVDENGEVHTVKKVIHVADDKPYMGSEYARFYDDGCNGWDKDPEYNLFFLRAQQNYANDLLRTRGHVFLNEVYDMLGIPRTKAGAVVGWYYDEDRATGDNYIDFGIYDTHREDARDFVNGYVPTILLDFNVDGPILEYIDNREYTGEAWY